MPKMKTHRGLAKRVKRTGTGKISHKQAYHHHKAANKGPKRNRQLRARKIAAAAEQRRLSRLVPYI